MPSYHTTDSPVEPLLPDFIEKSITVDSPSPHADKRSRDRQLITAYAELGEDNGGIILDASEAGFRIQTIYELDSECAVKMRFQSNRSACWAEATGRIAWTSQTKKLSGIEFFALPDQTRRLLREMLGEPTGRHLPAEDLGWSGTAVRGTADSLSPPGGLKAKTMMPEFPGIFAGLSSDKTPRSLTPTAIAFAVLFGFCFSGAILLSHPSMLSSSLKKIHAIVSESNLSTHPTNAVDGLPSSPFARRELRSSVSSPTSQSSPAPRSSSLPEIPNTVLQIAAMKHLENANALIESLKAQHVPAFIGRPDSGHFYKVFVGPYDDSHSLEIAKKQLAARGIESIQVQQSPPKLATNE